MYARLDTLESSGAELTAEQLDQAAGGIAMAVALIVSRSISPGGPPTTRNRWDRFTRPDLNSCLRSFHRQEQPMTLSLDVLTAISTELSRELAAAVAGGRLAAILLPGPCFPPPPDVYA